MEKIRNTKTTQSIFAVLLILFFGLYFSACSSGSGQQRDPLCNDLSRAPQAGSIGEDVMMAWLSFFTNQAGVALGFYKAKGNFVSTGPDPDPPFDKNAKLCDQVHDRYISRNTMPELLCIDNEGSVDILETNFTKCEVDEQSASGTTLTLEGNMFLGTAEVGSIFLDPTIRVEILDRNFDEVFCKINVGQREGDLSLFLKDNPESATVTEARIRLTMGPIPDSCVQEPDSCNPIKVSIDFSSLDGNWQLIARRLIATVTGQLEPATTTLGGEAQAVFRGYWNHVGNAAWPNPPTDPGLAGINSSELFDGRVISLVRENLNQPNFVSTRFIFDEIFESFSNVSVRYSCSQEEGEAGISCQGLPSESTCQDNDGDGIIDLADNCPQTANVGQEDSDGDGVGDACAAGTPPGDGDGDGDGNVVVCPQIPTAPNPLPEADPSVCAGVTPQDGNEGDCCQHSGQCGDGSPQPGEVTTCSFTTCACERCEAGPGSCTQDSDCPAMCNNNQDAFCDLQSCTCVGTDCF